MTYWQHIRSLASAHHIMVICSVKAIRERALRDGFVLDHSAYHGVAIKRHHPTATSPHTIILHGPLVTDVHYVIALHELGHFLGPHQGITQEDRQAYRAYGYVGPSMLAQEIDAWQWAYDHAMTWTPAMTLKASTCLATYQKGGM